MRNFLAKVIFSFSHLITIGFLRRYRRADVLMRAGSMLVECGTNKVNTRKGHLIFVPAERLNPNNAVRLLTQETDTVEWIETFADDSVYWDIGANIGAFALYAALNPRVSVLAFEPAAGSFAVLNRNIALNSMKRITAYCIAFADDTKLDLLNMSSLSPGDSMHAFGTEKNQFGNDNKVVFRQGTVGFSVDSFVKAFSVELPTYVKIDVDGLEADILRGGLETFMNSSVHSMNIEIEGDLDSPHNREILRLMSELGFVARAKNSPHLRNMLFDRRR